MTHESRRIWDLAVSPDGRTAASCGLDGKVRLWNMATGLELLVLDAPWECIGALAFSPDGRTLAGRTFVGSAVYYWFTAEGEHGP